MTPLSTVNIRLPLAALALDRTALAVFVHLHARGGQADSVCQLARWTGLSLMPCYYAVRRLEKSGLIFTIRTKRLSGKCKAWRTEIHLKECP